MIKIKWKITHCLHYLQSAQTQTGICIKPNPNQSSQMTTHPDPGSKFFFSTLVLLKRICQVFYIYLYGWICFPKLFRHDITKVMCLEMTFVDSWFGAVNKQNLTEHTNQQAICHINWNTILDNPAHAKKKSIVLKCIKQIRNTVQNGV